MAIWQRNPEQDLERRLRSERPQAPDELVRTISARLPAAPRVARSDGRKVAPRAILVAAATLALAASLGVVGAVGHASSSLSSFSRNVQHIVAAPAHHADDRRRSDERGSVGPGNGNDLGFLSGFGDPFHRQYGILLPLCHDGQIIYVSPIEYVSGLLRGDLPGIFCRF
jgi:hypothetical protein